MARIQVSLLAADMHNMFEWRKEYSVNIASIDAQHRNLFATAARLHEAVCGGEARSELNRMLDRLVRYTVIHFAYEERLMEQHDYPDLAAHKTEHEALRKQVLDFQREFQAGGVLTLVELTNFLKNWLEMHIQGTDHGYSPFLVERIQAQRPPAASRPVDFAARSQADRISNSA